MRTSSLDGLLVIDKPQGITSRAAVNKALRWFPRGTKLGHTGTLDPLATGVLVLCVGSATRLAEYVQRMPKTYTTTICLGADSDTDDAQGNVVLRAMNSLPSQEQIDRCLGAFLGEIEQVPPAFSAAKVTGRRAYDLARAGKDVVLTARRIHIGAIEVLSYRYPLLELTVHCGKGTYIRSLARDVGDRLGCGGYVQVLRRTRVGPFRAEDGLSLEADHDTARSRLYPLTMAVSDLPRVTLSEQGAKRLRQGAAVSLDECHFMSEEADDWAAFTDDGILVAIVRIESQGKKVKPVKVL